MSHIYFSFCLHNHQPVGNMDEIFENAYNNSYKPFVDVLAKYEDIKMNLHYTGILLGWLIENHPEFIEKLGALVQKGQVEILTGGYYEPILPIIPEDDRIGQINKLSSCVNEKLSYEPQGAWLAERVWEPQLAASLARAGVEYVVIDDEHFKNAGCRNDETYTLFITEDEGETLKIFPINTELRDMMPFQEPERSIEFLCSHADPDGKKILVMADDGEKFGDWPHTYKTVYEEKWLERFFEAILANKDTIKMVTFSEYLEHAIPKKIYLPTASYMEMSRWALSSDQATVFDGLRTKMQERGEWEQYKTMVRGGFWRNFLIKYQESDWMHKKMMWVSRKVKSLPAGELAEKAKDELWHGQCNCPYWHGVFGGLYLPHLRAANYEHMINAENIVDNELHPDPDWIEIVSEDFDKDGSDEWLISSHVYNLYFSPRLGGMLFELDYRPSSVNLLDTLSRRFEPYHTEISGLKYDWYLRRSFIAHFFPDGTSVEQFQNCEYSELSDFVDQPYEAKGVKRGKKVTLTMSRLGGVWQDGEFLPVELVKKVSVVGEKINIEINIKNCGNRTLNTCFGLEMNFSLLTGSAPDRFFEFPGHVLQDNKSGSVGEVKNVDTMFLKDIWRKISIGIKLSKKADFWRFPVETVSRAFDGYDRNYQSTVVLPFWRINVPAGDTWKVKLAKDVKNM